MTKVHGLQGQPSYVLRLMDQQPGIKPVTPGLQGERFIHYTTAALYCIYSSALQNRFYFGSKLDEP